MIGLLVRIGRGDETETAVALALQERGEFDRRRAPEAPAAGLWLERVDFERMCNSAEDKRVELTTGSA